MGATITKTIDNIVSIAWPGVQSARKSPPSILSTGSFPILFIRSCERMKDQRSLSFTGGLDVVKVEMVILLDAARQNTQEAAYEAMRKMADDVAKTLDENAELLLLDDYSVKEGFEPVQDTAYFAVFAEVRCA